jgi:undecaprenol kinase
MKSLFKRIGFRYALDGLAHAFKTQINIKIHLVVAALVVVAGLLLQISVIEWLFICLAIFMVFMAELANTAIESLTDMITLKFSPHAKAAKDVAAGMVLVAALGSVIIGFIIFLPYLL